MDLVAERNVATVVISKSGTTTEPAVAFRIVKEHIEKNYTDASERIVAITDAHKGALKTLSTQEGYKTFVVPDNVGGRSQFSLLSDSCLSFSPDSMYVRCLPEPPRWRRLLLSKVRRTQPCSTPR